MIRLLTTMLLSAMGLLWAPAQAQVVKWVDDAGKTHYGDTVPDKYKRRAKPVTLTVDTPSEQQVQEAQARVRKDVAQAGASASSPAAQALTGASGASAPQGLDMSCEAQWQRYDEAYACFNPYRNANGSVKAEAFKHCTQVKAPEFCPQRQVTD